MTCREKLKKEHPERVRDGACGGCVGCPDDYGYLDRKDTECPRKRMGDGDRCTTCWSKEILEDNTTSPVKNIVVFEDGHIEDIMSLEEIDNDVLFRTKWNAYKYEKCSDGRHKFYVLTYRPETLTEFYEEIDTIEAIRYAACLDRKIPESAEELRSAIKDSGDRTQFSTGAVRDMREGKGRCDLMCLDVVARILANHTLVSIASFQKSGQVDYLYDTLKYGAMFGTPEDMFLEVAKHFEDGAKKYGPDNWRKGIPVNCYIDSAVRHYLKFLRGDTDERHDRAFVWNILCCIWTVENMPELNNYKKDVN